MAATSLFILFLFSLLAVGKPDLDTDKSALLAFRAAVGRSLKWNASQIPCGWQGVQCDSGRVTVLRLPGAGLMGNLPAGIVGNLTELRTLSLRLNVLTGQLPPDLGACVNLRNLYLQGNKFTGEISPGFFGLKNLVRLNLAENNFSGEISPDFKNLTRLATLYLQNNRFSGSLPDIRLSLDQFNVSFNLLNGSIPSSLRGMKSESFLGNSLCGGPMAPCPGEDDGGNKESPPKSSKKLSGGAIAGIAIGSVVALLLLLVLLFVLCRRRNVQKSRSVDIATVGPPETELPKSAGEPERDRRSVPAVAAGPGGFSSSASAAAPEVNGGKKLIFFGNAPRVFDLDDLLRASAEVLGKGTFGTAYKAILEVGTVVAVKRLRDVTIAEREFRQKIESVGSMEHENLVQLRAYYYSKDEKLLVYDYMANGSLSALLHGNRGGGRTPLNWETRSGIALGAARGIAYLHSRGSNVSHGSIKSSNILLNQSFEARVSDFGLANVVGPAPTPTRIAGYRAPEVTDPHKISHKADVYSFGVLLLELLTGKAPTHALLNEEGVDLPRWVQSVVQEDWTSEVFDMELLRYQNVEEDMVQLLQLATDCAAQYPDKRPTMSEVVHRIEDIRRSSLQQDQGQHMDSLNDEDDGSSQRTNSVDGSGPLRQI